MEKKLTARQKMFCEYFVASGNATQSAIKLVIVIIMQEIEFIH